MGNGNVQICPSTSRFTGIIIIWGKCFDFSCQTVTLGVACQAHTRLQHPWLKVAPLKKISHINAALLQPPNHVSRALPCISDLPYSNSCSPDEYMVSRNVGGCLVAMHVTAHLSPLGKVLTLFAYHHRGQTGDGKVNGDEGNPNSPSLCVSSECRLQSVVAMPGGGMSVLLWAHAPQNGFGAVVPRVMNLVPMME